MFWSDFMRESVMFFTHLSLSFSW